MAHHYLRPDLGVVESGDDVALTGAEARHAATVSRVRVGERISIGDGAGLLTRGVVTEARDDRVVVRIDEVERRPAPRPALVLVQALAKGDRDELAVQAATELGVDIVVPWEARRSVSRWTGAKAERGRERWATIAREAAKQSLRPHLADVRPLMGTKDLCSLAASWQCVVLEPTAQQRLVDLDWDDDRPVALIVGPEGGIAPEESSELQAAGARSARLGREVLRTSTAGPAALAVLSARLGRW